MIFNINIKQKLDEHLESSKGDRQEDRQTGLIIPDDGCFRWQFNGCIMETVFGKKMDESSEVSSKTEVSSVSTSSS